MKTFVVALFAIVLSTAAFSQNKTLGVGTATPNTNAALHVESPTNNQGFIMPRLSTTQRTGIPTAVADDGLLMYDRDLKKFFFWDGAAWQPATGMNFPFTGLATTPAVAFNIVNSGTGTAGIFQISNAANSVPALGAATNGTGSALQIDITNASNTVAALNINHAGTGNAIMANRPIQASAFIGDGSALTNLPGFTLPFTGTSGTAATTFNIGNTGTGTVAMFANSNLASISAVTISNSGTGDGLFVNTSNPSNTFPAINIVHSGTGSAIRANRLIESAVASASGIAGAFAITNSSNASSALVADTNGNGSSGNFSITNAGSNAPVLFISHTGTGNAITTTRPIQASSFIGDGSALTNLPGGFSLPFTGSSGTGATSLDVTNTSTGNASFFYVSNGASPGSAVTANVEGSGAAIAAQTNGTGNAIQANVSNAANTNPAIIGIHTGMGRVATLNLTNPSNSSNALQTYTAGTGSAAYFTIDNASNTGPVVNITGNGSGQSILADGPIQGTSFIGDGTQLTGVALSADINIAAATQSVSIGKSVGVSDLGVLIGQNAGASNTIGVGIGNVFVGQNSGNANTSGTTNVFAGQNAGSNNDTGSNNVFIGGDAGLVSNGNTNVFVGWNAGANNTSGTSNVIIGAGAGTGAVGVPLTTGDNNTFLGTHASVGTDGLTNATAIGFEAIVNASNSIVLGNSNASVGIGVTSPTAKFHVVNGSPSGNTVQFSATNGANSMPAININHAGTGPAIQANQSNNGIAIDITSGTLKYSVFSTGTPGAITVRAGVYEITAGGAYTLPTAVNGETCLVYNSSGGVISGDLTAVTNGTIRQFVYVAGAWRIVN